MEAGAVGHHSIGLGWCFGCLLGDERLRPALFTIRLKIIHNGAGDKGHA